MNDSYAASVTVALIHHPVVDKNGETIAAAVTALDLHDIARAAKTYGIGAFYVVTPLKDQQELVRRITSHWTNGAGAQYNPDRRQALEMIRIKPSLESVLEELSQNGAQRPKVVVTSARMEHSSLNYGNLRSLPATHGPVLLLFGTAWGMADEVIEAADFRLAPITGGGDYNHLSVRSAVSIILDRMLGDDA